LGPSASQVLDLCEGRDPTPLVAYVPPRVIQEENIWDDPVTGYEPLRFVLRGLVARLSARLGARGLAAQRLNVSIEYDRSIARLHGAPTVTVQKFKLAVPLWKEEELGRVIGSRLERLKLKAPSIGLRLEATLVVPAIARQLDLSQVSGGITTSKGDDELPVLLAELYADIGQNNVGVLQVLDAHRPELKSGLYGGTSGASDVPAALQGVSSRSLAKSKKRTDYRTHGPARITRLLPQPLPLDAALRVGATVAIDRRLYTIERLTFEGGLEALVFVDRQTGARFLQAIAD
jgi:protein ImuB